MYSRQLNDFDREFLTAVVEFKNVWLRLQKFIAELGAIYLMLSGRPANSDMSFDNVMSNLNNGMKFLDEHREQVPPELSPGKLQELGDDYSSKLSRLREFAKKGANFALINETAWRSFILAEIEDTAQRERHNQLNRGCSGSRPGARK